MWTRVLQTWLIIDLELGRHPPHSPTPTPSLPPRHPLVHIGPPSFLACFTQVFLLDRRRICVVLDSPTLQYRYFAAFFDDVHQP